MEETKNLNKIHYVCTGGCGTVSNERIKCSVAGCVRSRNPLTECHCRNGKHKKIFDNYHPW